MLNSILQNPAKALSSESPNETNFPGDSTGKSEHFTTLK